MQKLALIALLTFSISVSAKVTLTAEEREVIDSLVATYSAMVPMAMLPADWPPDVEQVLREGLLLTKDLLGVALNITIRVDGVALFRPMVHMGAPDDYLPIQPTRHYDSTEIGFTNLDSGFAYIRWQQNRNDPLAIEKVKKALQLAKRDRCLILDLQKFDTGSIDSVVKALACFSASGEAMIREAKRVRGEKRDTLTAHTYAADPNAWTGPLLIVLSPRGWPRPVIEELLRERPYKSFYSGPGSSQFSAYKYARISLPHGYQCDVPESAFVDAGGNAVRSYVGLGICGNIGFRDTQELYTRYKRLALSPLNQFVKDKYDAFDRFTWKIEDLWDFLFANETPPEQLIE